MTQEVRKMSKSVLYMSMSLDGYIAGPNATPDNPGGDNFMRLHEWFGFVSDPGPTTESSDPSGTAQQFLVEINSTGAVLSDRNTVEEADHWGGDHHEGVPIFVVSHRPGPSAANYPLVTYVSDGIASAMAQAKAAAGDRNVLVHGGASTTQSALEAGVLDELQIHQVPVLFGGGRRLFDVLPARVELEIVRVIDTPAATHIRYRVLSHQLRD
jgi:dihydrofolate reductase